MSDLEAWRALSLGEVLDHLARVKEEHWRVARAARVGASGSRENLVKRAALEGYERAESAYVTLNRLVGYLETIEAPAGSGGQCGGPLP